MNFLKLRPTVRRYEFIQSQADHTMIYKHLEAGKVAILIVYVDDIILTRDDCDKMDRLKKRLVEEFEIKDLRVLK